MSSNLSTAIRLCFYAYRQIRKQIKSINKIYSNGENKELACQAYEEQIHFYRQHKQHRFTVKKIHFANNHENNQLYLQIIAIKYVIKVEIINVVDK